MGYGVVGSGVAEVLKKNNASITKRSMQDEMKVTRILDLRDFPGDENEALFTKDFKDILNDESIGIVVETMGGVNPAYDFVLDCLKAGKSVVTSNKELVAAKGYELLKVAEEKNVNFLFEASVGGGIPIIRPISQCLAANEIDEIAGILNGTTNFILTKMINDGRSSAMQSVTPAPTLRVRTPAERYAFSLRCASATTSIPTRFTPRVLQKLPLPTLSTQKPGAA